MNTEDYKKRFIDLFKEMKEELGECESVELLRENQMDMTGTIVHASYRCIIRF